MSLNLYLVDTAAVLAEFAPDTAKQYDVLKFLASLQGSVNRDAPNLFLQFEDKRDVFWLKLLTKENGMLANRPQVTLNRLTQVLDAFSEYIRYMGLVVWDADVPATANVATTICAVDGSLPVCGSLSGQDLLHLLTEIYHVPIEMDLRGKFTGEGLIPDTGMASTNSRKCDAYLWAMHHYLSKTDPAFMGYMPDAMRWDWDGVAYPDLGNCCLPNIDYLVARRAFVFDLGMWEDEAPNDDPAQPLGTDVRTLKKIMEAQNRRNKGKIISIIGFVPWKIKYTTRCGCQHEPVPAEWKMVELLSAYNAVIDADAYAHSALPNASVYRHYALKDAYVNSRPAQIPEYDPTKTYILFYMGDYDSAAWLTKFAPQMWADPERGNVPMMWCFNPNLADRNPLLFDYLYTNKTDMDYFAAGDSGAGYLNPGLLYAPRVHSDLPDAGQAWIEHNQPYYRRFDLGVTGFLLNGHYEVTQQVMQDFAQFSAGGVGHNGYGTPARIVDGVVFQPHTADAGGEFTSAEEAARVIFANTSEQGQGDFHIFRTVLWTPTRIKELMALLNERRPNARYELVDPTTYFTLLKQQLEKGKVFQYPDLREE